MASYRVLNGINYPGKDGKEKRAEPGETVDDLPEHDGSIDWLLAKGHIEPVNAPVREEVVEVVEIGGVTPVENDPTAEEE